MEGWRYPSPTELKTIPGTIKRFSVKVNQINLMVSEEAKDFENMSQKQSRDQCNEYVKIYKSVNSDRHMNRDIIILLYLP